MIVSKAIQDIHGAYTISVKNIRSGTIYMMRCTNIPVDGFTTRLYYSPGYLLAITGNSLQLAIGDGSNEPSSSDTALAHQLWRVSTDGYEQHFSSDFKTYTCVHTFTIPASTSYVGDISELGVYAPSGQTNVPTLITHSLLKDAENHPYTITKSDLDEITITYSISVTYNFGISVPALSWYKREDPLQSIAPLCDGGVGTTRLSVPCLGVSCRLRRYAISGDYALVPYSSGHGQSVGCNNITRNNNDNTPHNLGTVRVPLQSHLNNHFIFCFYSEKYAALSVSDVIAALATATGDFYRDAPLFAKNFPDATLFAISTLQNYSIGAGDGTTQDYLPPIPMWLDGTEKIYIDGVQQTRGVDYTCDSIHNLQKNIELTPLYHAFITDGRIEASSYFDSAHVYIHKIYICAFDFSYPQYGSTSNGKDTLLRTMAVHKDYVDRSQANYYLFMDNSHPVIFDLADEISKEVDAVYLYSYYDNDMSKTNAISISLEASNDNANWVNILSDVSAKGSSSESSASSVPIANWACYPLQSRVSYKYWRMSVTIKGMVGANSEDRYHSLGFILMRNGNPLHFNNAPAVDSVITMDCDINIPYKDDKHVIDVSAVITM